jgi:hypothetical protein
VDYGPLIRQLQGALQGNRIVAGFVTSAGAASGQGVGFTASRAAAGDYTLTWDEEFESVPLVVAMCGNTSGSFGIKQYSGVSATTSDIRLETRDTTTGTRTDCSFFFIAIG